MPEVYLGGKKAELYYFGRGHTNGDIVVLFPAERVLASGDLFAWGKGLAELVDYAGGGSAKEWTTTLDAVLMLPFDLRWCPEHGNVTNRAELVKFRDSTASLHSRSASDGRAEEVEGRRSGDAAEGFRV